MIYIKEIEIMQMTLKFKVRELMMPCKTIKESICMIIKCLLKQLRIYRIKLNRILGQDPNNVQTQSKIIITINFNQWTNNQKNLWKTKWSSKKLKKILYKHFKLLKL